MHHPFQVIAKISRPEKQFLLAASGPKLLCVNLEDGTIASQWQAEVVKTAAVSEKLKTEESNEPPAKKRKTAQPEQEAPNVTAIEITPDGSHAVIVTGEDKTIRVFHVSSEGVLTEKSQRCMAKRPSAITLTNEGNMILCADKFGDAYSLPLLPTPEQDEAARQAAVNIAKPREPAASETTVHSKANRRALEYQRKQAEEKTKDNAQEKDHLKLKETLLFAHDLLLGHVAMVIDIIAAQKPPVKEGQRPRSYVITSDRDEHIRVSRGPPQSHVIESFCLGHGEFVSKLCLVDPDILVSGGGDDDLFVWDWLGGRLLSKLSLRSAVIRVTGQSEDDCKIAVSGLWLLPGTTAEQNRLLIGCEGVPALFHCAVSTLQDDNATIDTFPLDGNLLDLAIDKGLIIVSIDNIHKPTSVTDIDNSTIFKPRLQIFTLDEALQNQTETFRHQLVEVNEMMTTEWHEKSLRTLLYGIGPLRKRRNEYGADLEE
ncbi:hypothetical protein BT63DRAFT_450069 [Microthyrium microscopicum]|uniref:Uncharacterized protein n=1 Tax=Microthyrium microscopicum TaxID=703497 RepID=A0A6A6URY7_9PEZI|nr:hypothetical protein BT63DRAFT_450069 [Microthyrium microscopicum]